MPVLLTGAGGFIGSNLLSVLEARGVDVASSRGSRRIDLDLETPGTAARLIDDLRPSHVVHAAAVSSLAECAADPARAFRVNAAATLEMADAARRVSASFVFFSTDQVGNPVVKQASLFPIIPAISYSREL